MTNKKVSCAPFSTEVLPSIKEAISFENADSSFYSSLFYSLTSTCIRFSSLANKSYSEALKYPFTGFKQKCINIAQLYSQQDEITNYYNVLDFLHNNGTDVSFRLEYLDTYAENSEYWGCLQLGFKYMLHSVFEDHDNFTSIIWNNTYDLNIYSVILNRISENFHVKIVLFDYHEGVKEFFPQDPGTYPVIYMLLYLKHFSVLNTEHTDVFKQNVEGYKHVLEFEPNIAIIYPKPLEVPASPSPIRNPNIPIPLPQSSPTPNNQPYVIPISQKRGFSPAQTNTLQADIIEILKSFSEEFINLKIYNQNIINLMTNLMRKYKQLEKFPVFSKFINFKPAPAQKAPNIPYARPEEKSRPFDFTEFRSKMPELPNSERYGLGNRNASGANNPSTYRMNLPVHALHNIDRRNAPSLNLLNDQSRNT